MKRSCIPLLALLVGAGFTCAAIFAQAPAVGQEKGNPDNDTLPNLPGQALGIANSDHIVLWGQFGLREESHRLAKQYVKSEKEDEKKEIRKKLTDVLTKQFDAQAKQQEKELADLEKQIATLKGILKKRQDSKTTIIDRRIDQLIQDADGLGWTAPSTTPAGANFVPLRR